MVRRILSALVAVCLAGGAQAATVVVVAKGAGGAPLAGAVVTLDIPGVAPPRPSGTYQVEQRDIAFKPGVLIVPVGATVAFPNRDRVRHHVYSFSKPKRFDLRLYGREDTRSVTFDAPGLVALGCNIHDQMNGTVFVTATPFAAVTDANGRAVLADVPPRAGTLRLFHAAIRAPGNVQAQPLPAGATGPVTVTVRR